MLSTQSTIFLKDAQIISAVLLAQSFSLGPNKQAQFTLLYPLSSGLLWWHDPVPNRGSEIGTSQAPKSTNHLHNPLRRRKIQIEGTKVVEISKFNSLIFGLGCVYC